MSVGEMSFGQWTRWLTGVAAGVVAVEVAEAAVALLFAFDDVVAAKRYLVGVGLVLTQKVLASLTQILAESGIVYIGDSYRDNAGDS